jgi:hypothetical protein
VASRHRGLKFSGPSKPRAAPIQVGVTAPMVEVLGEGGKGLQWQENVHLILHRKNKETVTVRFDEGGDDIWQSELSY